MNETNNIHIRRLGDPAPAALTLQEAATFIGASTAWTVRRLITSGQLPYVKVGKRFNIRREDLVAWLAAHVQREGAA
jgi:excisionase family DNA binding protein